jgi:hypothetical protein
MRTFPHFGSELSRPFEVDQRCFDCAELYHGCHAIPENPDVHCTDALRLPDVKAGTTGQVFPPSRMGDRKEPRVHRGTASAAPGKSVDSVPAKVPEREHAETAPGKSAVNTGGQIATSDSGKARDQAGKAVGASGKPKADCAAAASPCPKVGGSVTSARPRTAGRPNGATCGLTWNNGVRRHPARTQTCHLRMKQRTLHRQASRIVGQPGNPVGVPRSDQTTVLTNAV